VNNDRLEEAILGYAAKFGERRKVKFYALAIEGNHLQGAVHFPMGNRADFMRDFNSSIARAVPRHVPEYKGGRFWARRYSSEFLPGPEDLEEYFFYTVLQPIQDGLVEKLSEYPGYNCFHDAIHGHTRKFKVVRWAEFNEAKRHNAQVAVRDYIDVVELKYERLPGYEALTQKEYAELMRAKLEERRLAIVKKRYDQGLKFAGRGALLRVKPGSSPCKTKTSTITSHRPRVLSVSDARRAEGRDWYFDIYFKYKDASRRYRGGELTVEFPHGTYRPCLANHPPP
jgi:hypothetical protein